MADLHSIRQTRRMPWTVMRAAPLAPLHAADRAAAWWGSHEPAGGCGWPGTRRARGAAVLPGPTPPAGRPLPGTHPLPGTSDSQTEWSPLPHREQPGRKLHRTPHYDNKLKQGMFVSRIASCDRGSPLLLTGLPVHVATARYKQHGTCQSSQRSRVSWWVLTSSALQTAEKTR